MSGHSVIVVWPLGPFVRGDDDVVRDSGRVAHVAATDGSGRGEVPDGGNTGGEEFEGALLFVTDCAEVGGDNRTMDEVP